MGLSLPGQGRFRRRLALAFGRDEAAGDRLWRRLLHGAGAFVLLYYLLPRGFFVLLPNETVLLLALAAVLLLESIRLVRGFTLPTIRPYETRRPASFVFYAVALVVAVLLFPRPIAVAVVLGVAFVDPFVGELRLTPRLSAWNPGAPLAVYALLAFAALAGVGRWPWADAAALAVLAAGVGVGAERLRYRWLDDDLTMTLAPAIALYVLGLWLLGLPA
jgi:dolichol kinase